MAYPLTLFSRCNFNSSNNCGTYILLDSLYLPKGSMPAQDYPRDEDCVIIRIEDGVGKKLQMNCYGPVIEILKDAPRNIVVTFRNFVIGASNIPPMYADVSNESYGYIDETGSVSFSGPTNTGIYILEEVKTHLGRFTLELDQDDGTEFHPNCGHYQNTHWLSEDREEVRITAFNEMIDKLTEFQLQCGRAYVIINAVPWPNSRYSPNHFTIGPATLIEEADF